MVVKHKDAGYCGCKKCALEYGRAWRAKNKEKVASDKAAYYLANRARLIEKQRNYYEKNKAGILRVCAKYYERNKTEIIVRVMAYSRSHPEVAATQQRNRRALMKSGGVKISAAQWERIKTAHSYACAYCDKSIDSPEMDHVIPLSRGGLHSILNIVPACRSCNARKNARTAVEFFAILNIKNNVTEEYVR